MPTCPREAPATDAEASSPTDAAITSYSWMLVTGRSSELVEGQDLEITLAEDASYARAELTVVDDRSRASLLDVVFEGCTGRASPAATRARAGAMAATATRTSACKSSVLSRPEARLWGEE
jgi:hypothetical protein